MIYVYFATNNVNGKRYVGITKDPKKRWRDHLWSARAGSKYPFHCALRKYGAEQFSFEVVEQHESELEVKASEMAHIATGLFAYNATRGGDGVMHGRHHTEETKEKIRQAHLGCARPDLRVPWTDERKAAFREATKTRKKPERSRKAKSPSAAPPSMTLLKQTKPTSPKPPPRTSPWRRFGWLR